mmetsp:Transcript_49985/g.159874  ORF Transcript_49985/g.159874 Transcript_49985/m.159874 type:complete len:481 (-) Transcript_49985:730-2172(-)
MEAGRGQDSRVGLHTEIVVGAVLKHVVEVLALVGVSDLLPLARGEGDGGVHHGVQRIHKGHLKKHRPEEVRPQVHGGRDQQPAAAGAPGRQAARRRHAEVHERLRGLHKVGEAVLHRQVAALLVPLAAELPASTHMRHRVDHPAVQQAQAVPVEVWVLTGPVGAVAREQHREGPARKALGVDVLAVDQGNGHRPGRGLDALRTVQIGVEVRHLLLPHKSVLPAVHMVLVGQAWDGEGFVVVPQDFGLKDGVFIEVRGEGRTRRRGAAGREHAAAVRRGVGEGQRVERRFARPTVALDEDPALPMLAALQHQEALEAAVALELRALPRDPDVLPGGGGRVRQVRKGHAAELRVLHPVLVCQDVEPAPAVVHAILVLEDAPRHTPEARLGACEVQQLRLGGLAGSGGEDQEASAAGLLYGQGEALVPLLQHQAILRPLGILAELVPEDLPLAELVVQLHVVEAVARGPPVHRAVRAFQLERQ